MKTRLLTLGLLSLPLLALAANPGCSATGGNVGGAGGSGGAGAGGPAFTTVVVNVIGAGEVDVAGKSVTEPCARDAKGTQTGNCNTGWVKGDAPVLTAKAQTPGWHFQAFSDTKSGMTLSTMGTFKVAEGSTLQVDALFLGDSMASSSSSGGGCVNNVCPTMVATGLGSVADLTERGTDLYYIAGTLDKAPKAGGKPTTIVSGTVGSFAVDDAGVYWVDGTGASLFKANLDGTGTMKLAGLDSMQYTHAVAVDDTTVYVTVLVNKGMGNCTAVKSIPKAGGALTEVSSACDYLDVAKPYAIALNSTNVFWGTTLTPKGGALYIAPKGGNAVPAKSLAVNMNAPVTRVVADDTSIFYMQNGIRVIDAKSPGMPLQVGTTMASISDFAIDASAVFVAGGGGVSMVDRKTQKETPLANEPGLTITVDATDVYWATGSPGAEQILKIAK